MITPEHPGAVDPSAAPAPNSPPTPDLTPSAPTPEPPEPIRWRTPLPTLLARIFGLRTLLSVWLWCERHIYLDAQASPGFPGNYRSSRAPHTRWLQEQFTNPAWREIIIKKSSQSGVTEAVLNLIRYCVANRPRNILYMIDSVEEVKKLFRIRLIPSLRRCPETNQQINESAPDDVSTRTLYLRDMFIMGIGGQSEGAVANKPISLGIMDEADKIPNGKEGRMIDQFRARFKTIPDSLLIVLSKPVEVTDTITVEFETGTQHRGFLPCPHCGEFQEMVQERIIYAHCKDEKTNTYDKQRVLDSAYYKCINADTPKDNPKCPVGRITEDERRLACHRVEYRQTNFTNLDPGKLSVEITDLLSIFPDCTIGKIALDLIKAKTSLAHNKHVQAERFARAWKREGQSLKEEHIYKLCGTYARGTIPFAPVLVGLTTDVQGDVLKWMKHAFLVDGTHYIVDWGYVITENDLPDVWRGAAPYTPVHCTASTPEGTPAPVTVGLIDEGFRTKKIRAYVAAATAAGQLWFTSKGIGQRSKTMVIESPYEHEGIEYQAIHYVDDQVKQDLYLGQIAELSKIITGQSTAPRLWLPRRQDVDTAFAKELCAEELQDVEDNNGFTVRKWVKTGAANDYGDNAKMGKVLWEKFGADAITLAAERLAAGSGTAAAVSSLPTVPTEPVDLEDAPPYMDEAGRIVRPGEVASSG